MSRRFQEEVLRCLDENDLFHFNQIVQECVDAGVNLNLPYKESGNKTILQLALEEDDGEPYVDALLAVSEQSLQHIIRI